MPSLKKEKKKLKKSVVINNSSKIVYHRCIIKELAEESEIQFESLEEKTEKCITFSVPIKNKVTITKNVTYKIKFINSI